MPADEVARLRNVAIVGQGGTGKTTVADALLFAAGAVTRIGRVDDGSSAFDTEPEEQRRKSTITAALHHAHLEEARGEPDRHARLLGLPARHAELPGRRPRASSWCSARRAAR